MKLRTAAHATIPLILSAALATPSSAAAGAPPGVDVPASPPGVEALEYAFRFASAITPDPKDMGKAQEKVVLDVAATGDLEKAARLAEEVHNWRRGTALAEVARRLAARGDHGRAREIVERAALEIPRSRGWHRLRIRAHVAEARAWLGDMEAAVEGAAALAQADPVQYSGRAATIVIIAHAVRGEIEEALEKSAALDGSKDHDISMWRTLAYVEIAEHAEGETRRKALDRALQSSESVPGWLKAQALERVARALRDAGRRGDARKAIEEAVEAAAATPRTAPVRGVLLAELARTGASMGLTGPLEPALEEALLSAGKAMVIDRPGVYGNVAAAYLALGRKERAREILDRALDDAAGLENARPRALALVDICRYVGREGQVLDTATRSRLDELYGGLKAPW